MCVNLDDAPAKGVPRPPFVKPEWLCELEASVVTFRGCVAFGTVCLVREESR